MLWSSFIVWASGKVSVVRCLTWFLCGLALGIPNLILGGILLVFSLLLSFLSSRLEIAAARKKSIHAPKPVTTQNKAPQVDFNSLFRAFMTANENPPD